MPHRHRMDYPGAWHHVTNRAMARRTLFEGGRDVEVFLDEVQRESEAERIEVHAYCLMTTHFHFLVRSPKGELPCAMRRIQNVYARTFNRTRQRDGPLFRGRYANRVIETDAYWSAVLWYIDRNPISAGLAALSSDYPHGSATWYARADGPPWLTRSRVEAFVMGTDGRAPYNPARYPVDIGGLELDWVAEVVERRLRLRGPAEDPYRDLVESTDEETRKWMERKALLADGTLPGFPVASSAGVLRALGVVDLEPLSVAPRRGRTRLDTRYALQCGLLRTASGFTDEEIADRLARSPNWARERRLDHAHAMRRSEPYRRRAARVLAWAIAEEAGRLRPSAVDLERANRAVQEPDAPVGVFARVLPPSV